MSRTNPCRLVFTGSTGVGKTAIVERIVNDTFSNENNPTLGVQYYDIEVEVDGKTVPIQLWDTAGQEKYRALARTYLRNAHGIFLVFDITNQTSFNDLGSWISEIESSCEPNTPIILIGNKSDDPMSREIGYEDAEGFSKQHDQVYIETSAKSGENINEALISLASAVVRQNASLFVSSQESEKSSGCC